MYKRHSSLKNQFEKQRPEWGNFHAMEVPLHFDSQQSESASMRELAICDVSALPKLGVKGKGAAAWLSGEGFPIPNGTYERMPLDNGAMIIRLATDEFFLEDSLEGEAVANLSSRLGYGLDGVYRVERQDTGLLISGRHAHEVLAQTCSYPFEGNEEKVVMTRVALVSCAILPLILKEVQTFRLWFSSTYGIYLWQSLAEIVEDLGGKTVGVANLM